MECPFCEMFVRETPEAIHDHLLMWCSEKERWRQEEFAEGEYVILNPKCPCGYSGEDPSLPRAKTFLEHIKIACAKYGVRGFFTAHVVLD